MKQISLRLSNGRLLVEVPDQTMNRSATSLTLPGRGALNYAQEFTGNFVRLLENFSNDIAPANPLIGQLWYDSGTSLLKLWNGQTWRLAVGEISSKALPYTLVYRDENADFAARYITGDLIGTASEAEKWTSSRLLTIGGDARGSVAFDGTKNVTLDLDVLHATTADTAATAAKLTSPFELTLRGGVTGRATINGLDDVILDTVVQSTSTATPNTVMRRNDNGDVAANQFIGLATRAARWDQARLLTLTGDVTGTAQVDGSGDITLKTAFAGIGLTGVRAGRYTNATIEVQTDGRISFVQDGNDIEHAQEADHAKQADFAKEAEHAINADDSLRAIDSITAQRLKTPRTITLAGDVRGSVSFDGTQNVTIQAQIDDVEIPAAVNYTGKNLGSGPGQPYAGKVGAEHQFRSIKGAGGLTVTQSGTEITLTQGSTTIPVVNAFNVGTGQGRPFARKSLSDYFFRSIKGENGITIRQDDDNIYVRANDITAPELKATDILVYQNDTDVVLTRIDMERGTREIKIAETTFKSGGYGRYVKCTTGCTGGFDYLCTRRFSEDGAYCYIKIDGESFYPSNGATTGGVEISFIEKKVRTGDIKVEFFARTPTPLDGRPVLTANITFTGYKIEIIEFYR